MKKILISGGSGLVGSALSQLLTTKGYIVSHLSRTPREGAYTTYRWDPDKGEIDAGAIEEADAIVHLAGAGVADERWNATRKKVIYDSRVKSTALLREKVLSLHPKLSYFLSASAIGYYGTDSGGALMEEDSPKGEGFLADVTDHWEQATEGLEEASISCGKLRIGIVLSRAGGALPEIAKPIKNFAGAALGSGQQYMSWIHIEDLCQLICFMLEKRHSGTLNGVAPTPETNAAFTKKLAAQLKKPLVLPNVPKFALQLLVGEMADVLVGGNRVSSKRAEKLGFNFKYLTLEEALKALYK